MVLQENVIISQGMTHETAIILAILNWVYAILISKKEEVNLCELFQDEPNPTYHPFDTALEPYTNNLIKRLQNLASKKGITLNRTIDC